MENYPEGCEYPVLKIGQYPLPKKQLMQLVEACDEILVLEDGQPFVEKQLKGYLLVAGFEHWDQCEITVEAAVLFVL